MRGARVVAVLSTLAGCGRLGFDASSRVTVDASDGGGMDADAFIPLDPNLQLYLSFENTFVDSAKGRTVACSTPGCPGLVDGRTGVAGRFGGAECLRIADDAVFRTQQFTVALWVRSASNTDSSMFGKAYLGATSYENSFEIWKNSANVVTFTTSGDGRVPVATIPANGVWHHVAATYSAGVAITYFDGAMRQTTTMPTMHAADPIRVGCDEDSAVEFGFFHGDLDEVRYYDRVLAPTEIAALAQ